MNVSDIPAEDEESRKCGAKERTLQTVKAGLPDRSAPLTEEAKSGRIGTNGTQELTKSEETSKDAEATHEESMRTETPDASKVETKSGVSKPGIDHRK